MNIYVSNISFSAQEEDLQNSFAEHGGVTSVKIIMDKVTGKSKGFGFVEMEDEEGANKAIEALNGLNFMGRPLVVKIAYPKDETPRTNNFGDRNKSFNNNYNKGGNNFNGGYKKRNDDRYDN